MSWDAISSPQIAPTRAARSPVRGRSNSSRSLDRSLKARLKWASARARVVSETARVSAAVDRRNLARAGRLKKSVRTVTVVPGCRAISSTATTFPPLIFTRVPGPPPAGAVSNSNRETAAMDGNASPRKPSVRIARRSRSSPIFEVACRSMASIASSRTMPWPSSATRISVLPPARMSISMWVARASRAFSTSSLTADAGRSTTSPAAIWLAMWSGRM